MVNKDQQIATGIWTEQKLERTGTGPSTLEEAASHGEARARVVFSRSLLRIWGFRSASSLVDQGLTSGAGFAVNLLLARWMPPEAYGAFAVAFAGFLFVSGFYNVLLLEPLSVMGPARHAERLVAYFRVQITVHALLVGVLSAVTLLGGLVLGRIAPGSPLIGAVMGGGLAMPFLLLFWLARRMCYVVQRPSVAALGGGLYVLLVVTGLFMLSHFGWLASFTVFLLMGFGGVLAACLLLWRIGLANREAAGQPAISWRTILRENWTYGRWLAGSAVLYSVSSQAQMFLAAAVLGLGSAGILRAMQLPSLVMTQVVAATALLVLPVLSADFGCGAFERMRHKALLVSMGLASLAVFFAICLALFAGQVERLLFGGKYATYAWLMPVLALIPVVDAFSTGYSMALRASQKPQFDFLSKLVAAPVAMLSALCFIHWWGLAGGAASMVLGFVMMGGVTIACFRRGQWYPA